MEFVGIPKVLNNINAIFERRKVALYSLSLYYSALALQDFRRKQENDYYWTNRTFTALDTVFSDAFFDDNTVGWFIAHAIEYGVYLELANNGKYQALRPTIGVFAKQYYEDAKRIFED